MSKRLSSAVVIAVTALAVPVGAADYSDPTWPCVQRKVETLSLGLMWPHPVDPEAAPASEEMQADIDELAGYLSLRRVDLDSLAPRIEAFAETYQGDPAALGMVFAEVFDTLSKRRGRIIKGIEDFSLSQIALADKIDTVRAEMNAILAKAEPDFDKVDALEERLDWDQVIYTDRQRNIAYLCETPTLLERRLFSIAQMLNQSVRNPG
ncbi:hypothetical protein [Roseobacter sinensis]|uniref:Uncharacterized protein n=1 Tax=Roseobacter sinensis TaxID=2931391 RepID=A0ABT3BKH3_9RHOB|nr:hypothetical protein [Roseobacter sp. WL0113]MCV3274066.1 hypothetical protein [Roseobacter sp. WL0113]